MLLLRQESACGPLTLYEHGKYDGGGGEKISAATNRESVSLLWPGESAGREADLFCILFFCGGFVACFSGSARNFALDFLSIGSLKHSEQ